MHKSNTYFLNKKLATPCLPKYSGFKMGCTATLGKPVAVRNSVKCLSNSFLALRSQSKITSGSNSLKRLPDLKLEHAIILEGVTYTAG